MSAADDTPPARRVNRGRGHSYEIDGRKVDGVTTVLDDGIPMGRGLVNWIANAAVVYAEDHWDELVAATPSERRRAMEGARFETSKSALAKGTTIHNLAMRLAAGEEVDVPEEISGYIDAYLLFVEEWQPRELLVETPVFNRTHRYAGTPDLIADLADGWRWMLDWKSGGKGIFPEAAVQLAAYRNAEFYVDSLGRERALPDVDLCGCVWLRADGYDLYRVDAGERTFRVFQYAQQLARFGRDPRDLYISEAATPPRPGAGRTASLPHGPANSSRARSAPEARSAQPSSEAA